MANKNLIVVLGADTSGFDKAMDNVRNSTRGATDSVKKGFGGLTNTIGSVAKGFGKIALASGAFKVVNAGIDMVTSSFDSAIKRVDTLNQFPKVLQQMGYGADEAQKATTRLSEGIQGLPTTLDGIVGSTQRLVTIFGDVDLATESALALNNAFLASGASQADASRGLEQYTQMLSAGKVDMQSWRTLQETMPYALMKTAEAFGFTGKSAQNDFYKALQSGEITFDEFNAKIIELSNETGGFAEVALEASKGIQTSWSNIKTAVATGVAKVISAFDSWLSSKGFGGIAGVLDIIKVAVQKTFGAIVETIPTVLSAFERLYTKVAESTAWNSFKSLVGTALEAIQNLWTKFQETGAIDSATGVLKQVGQALLDIDFNKAVSSIGTFLDKWSPLIAGIAGAIGTFKLITGAITAWNAVVAISTAVTGAFGAVLAFITSPIGIIVVAIGALIAVGVALYQNWETVSQALSTAWTWVSEQATTIFTGIAEFFTTIWESIKEIFNTALEFIKNLFTVIFMAIQAVIQAYFLIWQTIIQMGWEIIKAVFETVLNIIKAIVDVVWNAIGGTVTNVMNTIKSVIETVWNAISTFFTTVLNIIKNIVTTAWNGIKDITTTIFNAVKGVITSVWNAIKAVVSAVVSAISSAVSTAWNTVSSITSSVFNTVRSIATSVWNGIKSTITSVVNSIKSVVSSVWNAISSTTSSVFNSIKSTATSVWNGVKSAMTKPVEQAKSTIKGILDAIKGFFSGIRLKLPSIEMPPLPHFSLSGSFSLKPPSVPKLSVSWYETGGIATSASVVGIGENGDEAILPLSNKSRMKPFAQAVSSMMDLGSNPVESGGDTIITGNTFVVREETDIKKIAQELYKLQQRERNVRGRR